MPQVVVIIGASAGIGRATAREFARRHSPLLWASERRGWIAAGTALALVASMMMTQAGDGHE